jgi:phosphonate C-P lyase system protein PhnG
MTCREGLGERFHLGEVLVAECQVLYRTTVGHAMVIGGDGRQALAAAVIDALRTHPDPHPDLSRIEAIVARAREEILAARYLQAQLSASTCVEFDLMPGA